MLNRFKFTDYNPYGAPHQDAAGAEENRLKFGGKELLTELGLNEYDQEARRHIPSRCAFSQPDPLAGSLTDPQTGDKLSMPYNVPVSPYTFCAADPINLIDPSGMDWVHCKKTDEFLWMDDVISVETTPEGYTYVGATSEDIVSYLGYEFDIAYSGTKYGVGLTSDKGWVAPTFSKTWYKGDIKISAVIDSGEGYENNKNGYVFRGLKIGGTFLQKNFTTNIDCSMFFKGIASVLINDSNYTFSLYNINEYGQESIQSEGYIPSQFGFYMYSNYASSLRGLGPIKLNLGSVNNNVFNTPISQTIKVKKRKH